MRKGGKNTSQILSQTKKIVARQLTFGQTNIKLWRAATKKNHVILLEQRR